jgi:hypothetical protein
MPTNKKESKEKTTFMNIMRIVEYPTLKFSSIAAGITNTSMIQLQFFPNQLSLSVKFNTNTNTMEKSPHGNNKNEEGFDEEIAMIIGFGKLKITKGYY